MYIIIKLRFTFSNGKRFFRKGIFRVQFKLLLPDRGSIRYGLYVICIYIRFKMLSQHILHKVAMYFNWIFKTIFLKKKKES